MKHQLMGHAARALQASAVALAITGLAGAALAEDKKITFKTPSAFGTNLPTGLHEQVSIRSEGVVFKLQG